MKVLNLFFATFSVIVLLFSSAGGYSSYWDNEISALTANAERAIENQEPVPHTHKIANYPSPSIESFSVDWDALAECESNQTWDINTGNSFYGGLQFNKMSWDWAVDVGGHDVPAWPHHATRLQQIAVAETLLDIHPAGLGAWPACTKALGWR